MNIEFELPIKDLLKQFGGGLPDVVDYQYYVNLQQRRIIVNEAICDTILESAVLPLIEMDNDGSGEHITIILDSPGGDVYRGFNLVDVIEKVKNSTYDSHYEYGSQYGATYCYGRT